MKLTTLVNTIGDDNITVQAIESSCVNAKDKKRTKDTEVTFATNEISANDIANGTGKVGLVIWMDRDKFTSLVN